MICASSREINDQVLAEVIEDGSLLNILKEEGQN